MSKRLEILKKLINASKLDEVAKELTNYQWDSEEELVILCRRHVQKILGDYLRGCFLEKDIELWANMIESRDDIGMEAEHENLLKQVIFHLSNPEITEKLTPILAENWIRKLDGSDV